MVNKRYKHNKSSSKTVKNDIPTVKNDEKYNEKEENIDKNNKIDELYANFICNFPNFEKQIESYELNDDDSLKIYTIQGGKFIFKLTNNGISLKSC